jgi:hypothetical protein
MGLIASFFMGTVLFSGLQKVALIQFMVQDRLKEQFRKKFQIQLQTLS